MSLLQLLLLAIVQGLTEFIPVSSSAHLILLPALIEGFQDQGRAIDVAAHVGSLFAVLIYFRSETGRLFTGGLDTVRMRDTGDRHLFLTIALATIPLVLFGAVLELTGLADGLRDPRVLATTSIVFGILLWIADRRPTVHDEMPSRWRVVAAIAVAQAIAVIPGTSRSGITITAARWFGYSREQSARFSMLLAVPAIAASGAFATYKLFKDGHQGEWTAALIVAVFSFLSAWLAIILFMKMTRTVSMTPFVIYRIALGIFLFILFT
ncbi:undecaprenyl-diphosphate phosphatase [Parvularcula sp. LCG005]|uniref:undecaprenyl-diphosphate phosphatase n=1 Tax=Parvularcula sp. LCG005 TaxID=3078805 RepID=UPI002941BDD6|nr:undecaprenyl-diphosphate phosphatase [Parvularcula sp. LCG005]WOI52893.1 undecaprenyl-diphosphate phosphatase [Parvularcula sp. LCG005]